MSKDKEYEKTHRRPGGKQINQTFSPRICDLIDSEARMLSNKRCVLGAGVVALSVLQPAQKFAAMTAFNYLDLGELTDQQVEGILDVLRKQLSQTLPGSQGSRL